MFVVLEEGGFDCWPFVSEDPEDCCISSLEGAVESLHGFGGVDFEPVVAQESFFFGSDAQQVVSRLLVEVVDIEMESFRLEVVEHKLTQEEFVVPIDAGALAFDSEPGEALVVVMW